MRVYFSPADRVRYKEYLSLNAKYQSLGRKIDTANDCRDLFSLQQAIKDCQDYINATKDPLEISILYYLQANAWSGRKQRNSWNWDPKTDRQSLIANRNAVRYAEKIQEQIPAQELARRYTNLANETDEAGLFIEAGEWYDKALSCQSNKGVALFNKGISLAHYSGHLFGDWEQRVFAHEAAFWFQEAIRVGSLDLQEEFFPVDVLKRKYAWFFELSQPVRLQNVTEKLNFAGIELEYRRWVVEHKLFLNPLNDICTKAVNRYVLEDSLTTPSFTFQTGSKRAYLPLRINQLKQEFIAARTLFFEGITSTQEHYSDHCTHLESHPMFSGSIYAFYVEKIKCAFRSAYSLFDKIAEILAAMYDLGGKRNTYFRTFWYENEDYHNPLKSFFSTDSKSWNFNRPNWPLRALFSIANDFLSNEHDWRDSVDEEIKDITTVRNALEHSGLDVRMFGDSKLQEGVITFHDLLERTIYLLKKSRNAIIYLILAIHCESLRESEQDNELRMPLQGQPYSIDDIIEDGISGLVDVCYAEKNRKI